MVSKGNAVKGLKHISRGENISFLHNTNAEYIFSSLTFQSSASVKETSKIQKIDNFFFFLRTRYAPNISKKISLSCLSNFRHGTQNWRDLQSHGLKPVSGNMDQQAFFHQLDRIWGHTGEGSLRYCLM